MEIKAAPEKSTKNADITDLVTPARVQLSVQESREEWAIGAVAQFLADRIREAAETAFSRREAGEARVRVYDVMPEIWPAGLQTHKSEAHLPAGKVPFDIAAQSIRFYPGDGGDSIAQCGRSAMSGEYTGIVIYLGSLDAARSREDLEGAIRRFERAAWHESEHIFHMGADYDVDPDADEQTRRAALVEYLSNPGEVRAHARQYALEFHRAFPGEPFCVEKFLSLDGGGLARYYLRSFADPSVQARYAGQEGIPPLAETHAAIVELASEMTLRFGMDRSSLDNQWGARQSAAARLLYAEVDSLVEGARNGDLGALCRALCERPDVKEIDIGLAEIESFIEYVNQTPPSAGSFTSYFARHGRNLESAP